MLNKNHPFLIKVILFIYVLYSFMPVVAYYVPSILRVIMALFLWFYFSPKISIRWFAIIIFPIFSVIELFFNSPSQFFTQLYYIINLGTLAALSYTLIRRNDLNLSRQLVFLLVITFVINGITTYYGNIIYPNASRLLASAIFAAENYDTYQRLNIGGFDVVYSLSLAILLAAIVFKKKKGVIKLGVLLIAILFLMAVIKTEYSTALIFALVSFLFFFIPLNSNFRTIVVYGFLLFGFVILWESFDFFSFISSLSGSDAVGNRMNDLSDFFQGNELEEGSDVLGRYERYMLSLKGFFSSPIFGSILTSNNMVGGHSFILDNLSRYGLIGLFSLWYMYSSVYKLNIKLYAKLDFYYFAVAIFIIYLLLNLLNPQPFIPFVSFALPLFFYVLSRNRI